ncbi:hypothetical protein HZS_7921 [Henneguya salminicola]|nr:hypothetical protein HZS_7921 [Henneguya salminicola]
MIKFNHKRIQSSITSKELEMDEPVYRTLKMFIQNHNHRIERQKDLINKAQKNNPQIENITKRSRAFQFLVTPKFTRK